DDLLKLRLGRGHVRDILEGDAALVFLIAARGALDVTAQETAAQRVTKARQENEEEQAQEDQGRQQHHYQSADPAAVLVLLAKVQRLAFVSKLLGYLGQFLGCLGLVKNLGFDLVAANLLLDLVVEVRHLGFLELTDSPGIAAKNDALELA